MSMFYLPDQFFMPGGLPGGPLDFLSPQQPAQQARARRRGPGISNLWGPHQHVVQPTSYGAVPARSAAANSRGRDNAPPAQGMYVLDPRTGQLMQLGPAARNPVPEQMAYHAPQGDYHARAPWGYSKQHSDDEPVHDGVSDAEVQEEEDEVATPRYVEHDWQDLFGLPTANQHGRAMRARQAQQYPQQHMPSSRAAQGPGYFPWQSSGVGMPAARQQQAQSRQVAQQAPQQYVSPGTRVPVTAFAGPPEQPPHVIRPQVMQPQAAAARPRLPTRSLAVRQTPGELAFKPTPPPHMQHHTPAARVTPIPTPAIPIPAPTPTIPTSTIPITITELNGDDGDTVNVYDESVPELVPADPERQVQPEVRTAASATATAQARPTAAPAGASTSSSSAVKYSAGLTKSQAARIIQRHWRGWRLWGQQDVLHILTKQQQQLQEAYTKFYTYLAASDGHISHKQYLEVNELAMRVLLALDACSSPRTELRAVRKRLTNKALALQDQVSVAYQSSSKSLSAKQQRGSNSSTAQAPTSSQQLPSVQVQGDTTAADEVVRQLSNVASAVGVPADAPLHRALSSTNPAAVLEALAAVSASDDSIPAHVPSTSNPDTSDRNAQATSIHTLPIECLSSPMDLGSVKEQAPADTPVATADAMPASSPTHAGTPDESSQQQQAQVPQEVQQEELSSEGYVVVLHPPADMAGTQSQPATQVAAGQEQATSTVSVPASTMAAGLKSVLQQNSDGMQGYEVVPHAVSPANASQLLPVNAQPVLGNAAAASDATVSAADAVCTVPAPMDAQIEEQQASNQSIAMLGAADHFAPAGQPAHVVLSGLPNNVARAHSSIPTPTTTCSSVAPTGSRLTRRGRFTVGARASTNTMLRQLLRLARQHGLIRPVRHNHHVPAVSSDQQAAAAAGKEGQEGLQVGQAHQQEPSVVNLSQEQQQPGTQTCVVPEWQEEVAVTHDSTASTAQQPTDTCATAPDVQNCEVAHGDEVCEAVQGGHSYPAVTHMSRKQRKRAALLQPCAVDTVDANAIDGDHPHKQQPIICL